MASDPVNASPVTHELRGILARQSMAAQETRFPAIGRDWNRG